jgi:mannose-6-phosphate isomerase-like protein (cupin superfamily)
MSGYTLKNFMDIEDAAAERSGGTVQGRFARSHIESEHLGVSHFKLSPDLRLPFAHSHTVQEEVYVVISGSGRVKLDGDVLDLKQWDVLRVAPTTVRAFASGPEGLEYIVVGSDRPEEGDGVVGEVSWED